MKLTTLAALALLTLSAMAQAGELSVGVGKTLRYGEGFTGGALTVAWRTPRWEARLLYVGAETIYPQYGGLHLKPYYAFVVSRVWTFRPSKNFQPAVSFGLMLKGDDRCHYDGDLACNRRVPLPFAFGTRIEAAWTHADLRIGLWHFSNDSLDTGHSEGKNLGDEIVLPELVVWRSNR